MKKYFAILMALLLLAGCASNNCSVPTDAELEAQGWVKNLEENGYIKMTEDTVSSATDQGKGLTFGYYEQSDAMKQKTVLEYLSGLHGNYREMYQIATAVNNIPTVSSVEYVLDPANFNLYGISELGTEKTLHFAENPNVSLYWTRQLREAEEAMGMTYFSSYGVQITGTVHIFTVDELDADPTELLHFFDTYYPTMPTTAAVWSTKTTEEARIEYIRQVMSMQVVYKIVPSEMVITQPYMLHMGGKYASCAIFTSKGENGYGYPDDFINDSFFDAIIEDKVNSAEYKAMVDQMFPETEITDTMSDEEKAAAENVNATRALLLGENTCGIKTQQTLTNFTPAN